MASYLQIENISKSYGPKVLFEHIGFNINEGDKIALIAPNGTGKTSLMRILAGKDRSDSGGKILFLKDIRIAFLEQEYDFDPEATMFDQIMSSSSRFTENLDQESLWEYERRVTKFLTSFSLGDGSRRMKELSGGEIKRVALSQLLATEADFLIMDEPTNHLDIDAIEFLEGHLSRSRCTLFMVTHDRYFLDRVCNTVMEMDRGSVYIYKGNYQNYLEKREERVANYNAETDKVRNILRRELEWIHATPCARSGKARYRINAFHELKERAEQVYTRKQLSLEGLHSGSGYGFNASENGSRLGTKIIDCKNVTIEAGERKLVDGFSYNFQRYEKVGIVGNNGCGKTTLLDAIADGRAGIELGDSVRIGYYRQRGIEFDEDQTVLETVYDTRLLTQFLFPRDMLTSKVRTLSGGEKRRLYLLTVLMQNPNVLLLDEPTNDLDIVTLNVLEEYLKDFRGTLLVVSHDRHFLDRIADHLFVFCGDGSLKDFTGNSSEWRAWLKDHKDTAKEQTSQGRRDTNAAKETAGGKNVTGGKNEKPRTPQVKKLSWKEQRELEQLEADIEALAAEKASLEEAIGSGTLPFDKLQAASERIGAIIAESDEKELRWLSLSC